MEKKTMVAFSSPTIRGLVKATNENNITRENIVSILQEGNQYVLVYYI